MAHTYFRKESLEGFERIAQHAPLFRISGTHGEFCQPFKTKYRTKKDAVTMKNYRQKLQRGNGRVLHVYPCPQCNGWHIGKNTR